MQIAKVLFLLVMTPLSSPLWAQYDYGAEISIGPSFLRFKPGDELDQSNLAGWHAAVTGYYKQWIGLTLDVAGEYGNVNAPSGSSGVSSINLTQHSFMMGPQVRFVRKKRWSAMVQFLMGGSRGNADPDVLIVDGERDDLSVDNFRFSSAIGAGLSINLGERVAWRVIEPTYFLTAFGGRRQQSYRISTGIVFRCCVQP
jgi:hypothetical protein